MSIQIKQLQKEDAQAYKAIRLEMLEDTPEAFGDTYEEANAANLKFYEDRIIANPLFGAFSSSKLIGTAGWFVTDRSKVRHKAFLWGVYITPEERGRGLSFELTQAVLDSLPNDIDLIQTCVVVGNKPAQKTYEKAGFIQWAVEEKALKIDGQYYDEVHMVKFLK